MKQINLFVMNNNQDKTTTHYTHKPWALVAGEMRVKSVGLHVLFKIRRWCAHKTAFETNLLILFYVYLVNEWTRPDTRPSVADGWAGAEMRVFSLFDSMVTDGPTNGRTNGRTDKASYRVACPQLKRSSSFLARYSNILLSSESVIGG